MTTEAELWQQVAALFVAGLVCLGLLLWVCVNVKEEKPKRS